MVDGGIGWYVKVLEDEQSATVRLNSQTNWILEFGLPDLYLYLILSAGVSAPTGLGFKLGCSMGNPPKIWP